MKKIINKYVRFLITFTLAILLALGNWNLPFNSTQITQSIIGQVATADEGNYLPYEAGVTLPVSRTTGHGYAAIDFAQGSNSNVRIQAVRSGKVVISGKDPSPFFICKAKKSVNYNKKAGYGYYVTIKYTNGVTGLYAHLKEQSSLQPGDIVNQGDFIGILGNTGCSTGEHLHYEHRTGAGQNTSIIPTFKEYPNETVRGGKSYTSQNSGNSSQLSNISGLVSAHRGGNGEVYINWEDGGWKSPAVKVAGPYGPITTDYSPTVIRDKFGRVQLFHVGISGEIYQMILQNDGSWDTKGLGYYTNQPVSVVLHEGYLNLYFKDLDNYIFNISSLNNESWGSEYNVIDWQSELPPAVTVRGSTMLLAIVGLNNHVYTYTGTKASNFRGPYEIQGFRSSRALSVATYKNYFIMMHVGDNKNVYQNHSFNGSSWSRASQIPSVSTDKPVTMGVENNKLNFAHIGLAGHIYYMSSGEISLGFGSAVKESEGHFTQNAVTISHQTQDQNVYAD